MLKKITLLAMALAALTALAVPAIASAETKWIKGGETLAVGTNDLIHLEGPASFTSEGIGNVHCTSTATAEIELTGGGHNGKVKSFGDTNATSDCHVSGLAASLCGTTSLHAVSLDTPLPTLTGTAGVKTIHVSGIDLTNVFGSTASPCLVLTLSGGITATTDSNTEFKEVTLSGELTASGGFGKVKVGGVLKPTNAAQSKVYGLEKINTP